MLTLILEDAKERMNKTIDSFKVDLSTVRAGRASPKMLDRVMVDYWGTPTPINQTSGISVVEGRQLVIKPYDRSILRDIERAIFEANLGLTPQNDGTIIRITVPPLTEERRREYVKTVKKYGEEAKVALRNIRRSCNDEAEKADLPEDQEKLCKEKIQKLTDEYVKKIDELVKEKEKDLMTV